MPHAEGPCEALDIPSRRKCAAIEGLPDSFEDNPRKGAISPQPKGIEENFWYPRSAFRTASRLAPASFPNSAKRQPSKFRPISVKLCLQEQPHSNFNISTMEEDSGGLLVPPRRIWSGLTFGTGLVFQIHQASTSKISTNQI